MLRQYLGKLMKRKKLEEQIDEEEFMGEEDLIEERAPKKGEYVVPENLKEDGFYLIQSDEAYCGRYDCGFFPDARLYDRKERIAIDVRTAQLDTVLLLGGTIEEYLTGQITPEFTDFPTGVKRFAATELSDSCYDSLRQKMVALRDANLALDSAVDAFKKEATGLKTKYFPSDDAPET